MVFGLPALRIGGFSAQLGKCSEGRPPSWALKPMIRQENLENWYQTHPWGLRFTHKMSLWRNRIGQGANSEGPSHDSCFSHVFRMIHVRYFANAFNYSSVVIWYHSFVFLKLSSYQACFILIPPPPENFIMILRITRSVLIWKQNNPLGLDANDDDIMMIKHCFQWHIVFSHVFI